MARAHQITRLIDRLIESALLELARGGARRGKKKQRKKANYTNAVVRLSEGVGLLADQLKKQRSPGKLGANLRSVISDIEELRPIIEAGAKSLDEEDPFKSIQILFGLGARAHGQFDKDPQTIVMLKEYQRQYVEGPNVKLLPPDSPTVHATKQSAIQIDAKASSKKTTDASDDWNDNDDNDNDNEPNPNDYDWEDEYDQAVAEHKRARRRHRNQND